MTKTRAMLALVALVSAACEPIVSVLVHVRIRPTAVQAYRGGYPAEILVSESTGEGYVGYAHLGVLCSSEDANQTYTLDLGGIGCANETRVEAWILPVKPSPRQRCGPVLQQGDYLEQPPATPPVGNTLVMKGVHQVCGNYRSTESFDIGMP